MSGNKIGFNLQTISNLNAAQEQTPKTKTLAHQTVLQTDEYIIKRGDTLTEIAAKTGQNLQELLRKNPQIKNPNRIRVGQHIEIGKQANTYTVKKGDTLSEIAKTNQRNKLRWRCPRLFKSKLTGTHTFRATYKAAQPILA